MSDPITKDEMLEMEALDHLSKSRFLRNILLKYREGCAERSKEYLRKHDDRKAGEWLAKSDAPLKISILISDRCKELQTKYEGGKN